MISRREAITALASTMTLPLISGCTREPASTMSTTTEADALALLEQVADNLLRLAPESATSLGIDTGARAALRSQLTDRSAQGQQQIANQLRERSGARQRLRHVRPLLRDAHQRRGRAQRLCDGARRIRAPLRRRRGRRLAQHAVRRHPERRRLSRHPAISRRRAPHRERRRRRGLSGTAAVVREAARRRAWPHPGGARRGPRAAGVPDRQGAGADDARR